MAKQAKVLKLIKKLNAPQLTETEIEKLKEYHRHHGGDIVQILGALPHCGVLVRIKDSDGTPITVINYGDGRTGYSEGDYYKFPTQAHEIALIEDWVDELNEDVAAFEREGYDEETGYEADVEYPDEAYIKDEDTEEE